MAASAGGAAARLACQPLQAAQRGFARSQVNHYAALHTQDGNKSELIKQAVDGVHGLPLILRHFLGAVAIKPVSGKM
nr:hypothetical protein 1577p_00022 [Serratia marcescens]